MEGPTPVSALIHAATLVTAGVFVMVRLHIFFDDMIILVGALSALMGGIFGLFQNDIKRVIAFSTCSQLGYMMVSVGLGEFGADAAMGHLVAHASFKAALFLAAGVLIMASAGNQNITRFGATRHCSLLSLLTILVASLSLVGFPETAGFYSKETIINLTTLFFDPLADYAHFLLVAAAFATSAYSVKLFCQAFLYDYSGSHSSTLSSSSLLVGAALSILLLSSVFQV